MSTDPNLIADLIRAGVAPELVQRVVTALVSQPTSADVSRQSADVSRRDDDVLERRRARERDYARKKRAAAKVSAEPTEKAQTVASETSQPTSQPTSQGVFLLPILSSSYESIQGKEESNRGMHARARGDPAFDHFWERYPHKVGKRDALKCFERVKQSGAVTFEALMEGLERYRRKTDDRPWCNPSTWLNQGRWEDVPNEVNSNGKSILAAIGRARERIGGDASAYVPKLNRPGGLGDDAGQPTLFRVPKG